jgi:hypothetical protein
MAEALVHAIRNPQAMQAQAQHGQRIVLDAYDWGALAKKLDESWEKACASSN